MSFNWSNGILSALAIFVTGAAGANSIGGTDNSCETGDVPLGDLFSFASLCFSARYCSMRFTRQEFFATKEEKTASRVLASISEKCASGRYNTVMCVPAIMQHASTTSFRDLSVIVERMLDSPKHSWRLTEVMTCGWSILVTTSTRPSIRNRTH